MKIYFFKVPIPLVFTLYSRAATRVGKADKCKNIGCRGKSRMHIHNDREENADVELDDGVFIPRCPQIKHLGYKCP